MIRFICPELLWQRGAGHLRPWLRLLSNSAPSPLRTNPRPFLLADIGEGISEVEILRWHVKPGDVVSQFDPLVEVQSDKATVEITSRFDGVVHKLQYDVGDMAAVGAPLCFIQTEDTPLAEPSPDDTAAALSHPSSAGDSTPHATSTSPPLGSAVLPRPCTDHSSSRHILAVPAVRRLAKEHGVDITALVGTGKDGRVTKDDIYRYINEPEADVVTLENQSEHSAEVWVPKGRQVDPAVALAGRTEKIRGLQRAMVKSMTAAALIPQLGLGDEICMDALYRLRSELKPVAEAGGVRLTYLPFFIKAASLALTDFPLLNASVDETCEHITYHDTHNISVAMDTSHGLVVPNVKHVERLSIIGIARELGRLAAEATASPPRFSQEDLAGGTFALSNIGSIGGTYTSPVVMPPQVAIGALGRMRTVVAPGEIGSEKDSSSVSDDWSDDQDIPLVLRRVIHVSWSADHRVVDGATMANFSNAWKRYVEAPHLMLMHLK